MANVATTVDLLTLFADPARVRLLALLASRELSVADLTEVTQLSQSRVSTHLGRLREAGVVQDRRRGASTLYSFDPSEMPDGARPLWSAVSTSLRDPMLEADRTRCDALLRARENGTRWPDAFAGEMERHYSPGRTWESIARGVFPFVALGDVLDVGAGDGSVAELLAPRARSYVCLDVSAKMVEAASARLAKQRHVTCALGDMHELPFDRPRFDQVLLFNVLTSSETPARGLVEAARVLRPGGTVAVVTLNAHAHRDIVAPYRHRHAGFTVSALRQMLTRAGLTVEQCEITSRERRPPYFEVVTAIARKKPSVRSKRT